MKPNPALADKFISSELFRQLGPRQKVLAGNRLKVGRSRANSKSMPDGPTVKVSKVSGKGAVQLPLATREKLNLKPGTKLIVVVVGDSIVLWQAELLIAKEKSRGTLHRLRSMFSKARISDIEG